MYLKVNTLSDIATADGRAIHPNVARRIPFGRRDSYAWPLQGKPAKKDWTQWDAVLHTAVKHRDIFDKGLGPWKLDPETYLKTWDWFQNNHGDLIFATPTEWRYYTERDSRHPRFKRNTILPIPEELATHHHGALFGEPQLA